MASPILPSPLPKWAKYMVKFWEWDVPGLTESLLDILYQEPNPGKTWRHLQIRFSGVGAGWDTSNDAYIGFDLTNITAGVVDDTWTDADFVQCEGRFSTWLQGQVGIFTDNVHAMEYRWYRREFNDINNPKPFADSGPPVRVTPINYVGGTGNPMTPQVALSLTERTPLPKHWGRVYFPFLLAVIDLEQGFQMNDGQTGAQATAFELLYDGLMGDEFQPVVPMVQDQGRPARGLVGVNAIQVDSILDVQRRRRPDKALFRHKRPVGP